MIMSVKEFKTFVETDMAEPLIEAKLQSLELLIRKYTNNNFQNRLYRRTADIIGGSFYVTAVSFKTGDTIQVSTTQLSNGLKVPCLNEGLFTIDKVDNNSFSVKEDVVDESNVLCTKIATMSEEEAKKILRLKPVDFDYIEAYGGEKNQHGLIAEDTLGIIPSCVTVPEGYSEKEFDAEKGIRNKVLAIDYSKLVPYLIKMVQIQQEEIEKLKEAMNKEGVSND